MDADHSEVVVVGGGPAGLLAALLAARAGAATTLIAPPPPQDARTTALLEGSVAVLREAGVWDSLQGAAAPLRTLRIVDGGRRLFRAPEATFRASELGLEAFGWNVPNTALTAALAEAFMRAPGAARRFAQARESRPGEKLIALTLDDGSTIEARLAIAADGRNSLLRDAAGISFKSHRAPQTALAFAVEHDREHEGVSTEFHFEEGPFTLVPMPGRRSSIVWVATPVQAEELSALSPEALGKAATRKSGRILGEIRVTGSIGRFPITVGAATCFAARRTLLVGEAGHVLPPIGAQGFNLGVRDAARAAVVIAAALAERRDPGGAQALGAYSRARAADVLTRAAATDLLNLSLLSRLPPVHFARGVGLAAISRIGPLRRFVMREGLLGAPGL